MRRVFAALLIAAAPFAAPPVRAATAQVFDETTPRITVTRGQTFQIELVSNASTGFHWVIDGLSRPGVVNVIGSSVRPPQHPIPGAPGRYVKERV